MLCIELEWKLNKPILTLLQIYGCRIGEIKAAKKEHFDFEFFWTIPIEHHKTGKKTKKPLKREITENIKPYLIEAMELSENSEYLVTADGTTEQWVKVRI